MRRVLLALIAAGALAACSEEDRRAWVSILPDTGEDEEEATAEGPFSIARDSTAVLMGRDTLFTVGRIPARADGHPLANSRIGTAQLAPDSSSIAVALERPTPAVVVWSRPLQTAHVTATFPDGAVTTMAWSPDGRLLAYQGRGDDGVERSGVFDVRTGQNGRHPVLSWLERRGRSVRFQDWVDARHARFLVAPGAAPEGGLAHVWSIEAGAFVLEPHVEALRANAPAGRPVPGGVFSLDLAGDPHPETVALYRAASGAPGALVLQDAGPGGVRAAATEPLVALDVVGLEDWKDAERGPGLYQIVELGGRPTLLLTLPARVPITTVGIFQATPEGRLRLVTATSGSGAAPALFADGTVGHETHQLGFADLDGDGAAEVVAATGRANPVLGEIDWSAEVYRWDGDRLVAAPSLEPAAIERVEGLVGGG